MQIKYKFSHILSAFSLLVLPFSSCSDDEELLAGSPSYRDGIYSGTQLSVTLDGENLPAVSSVSLSSVLLDANVSQDKDDDQVASSNPTYTTTVKIAGFPTSDKTSSFTTVSTLTGFSGTASIYGMEYKYEATFTGDPLTHHENQGLILMFTK